MNNQFSFEFADAVVLKECIGNIRIGNVSEGEAAVSARYCDDGVIALDFSIPAGKDGKDGESVKPALYVKEIRTEPFVNIDGEEVGAWKESFMSDGTVRAEATVNNMYFSVAETYTDYGFILSGGFGKNCFNDPTNFTLERVHVEVVSCSSAVILTPIVTNNCSVYPSGVVFRTGGTLPSSVTVSYKVIAEGREKASS